MKYLGLVVLAGLILLFQNCGQFEANGNGNGYGGFSIDPIDGHVGLPNDSVPYDPIGLAVYESKNGQHCEDGDVSYRIEIEGNDIRITRDACADVDQQLAAHQIVRDRYNIVFEGRTYNRVR